MLKAVIFDAAGTLFMVRGSVGEIYARAAQRLGVKIDPHEVEGRLQSAIRRAPPLAFPHLTNDRERTEAEHDWWRDRLSLAIGLSPHDRRFEPLFKELYEYFSRPASWTLYPDARPAVEQARDKGLKVAIVSNFDSRLPAIVKGLGLGGLVSSIIYSSQTGVAKPGPKIFLEALDHLAVAPEEALHIGNELEADYHGARAAGLHAILLDRGQTAPRGTEIPVIGTLHELSLSG